ncbi:MAG: poly(R)-hydroxyalkanoic acid synthase subunit PhaE [Bacteroidia bacterium]|nr:poly(R)-hydroxyalkanoic acid synthase subunit PhaE [Bacteroidia bacterium]
MATSPLIDQVLDSQNKMMESWLDMSKNMMRAFEPGGMNTQRAGELFNEWYTRQQELLTKALQPEQPQDMLRQTAEQYRKLMEMQVEYTRKWMETARKQWDEMLGSGGWSASKPLEQWTNITNQILRDRVSAFMPFSSVPRMDQFTNAYQELQKSWEPIQKAIQEGWGGQDATKFWISPEAWQGVISKLTNFNLPDTMKSSADHASRLFGDYLAWVTEQTAGYTQQFPKSVGGMDFTPWTHMLTEVQHQVEKNMSPFFHMMNQGKQRQMLELVREAQTEYLNFAVRGTELQARMMEAGQQALPEVMRMLSEQYARDQKLPDYDTFFQTFVGRLEEHLVGLFETQAYAEMQNDLSLASVRIKNRMEKFMEMLFEGAPFTMRSETIEIVQELQELRRRVRALEKQLAQDEPGAPADGQPAAKAPRSRKKSEAGS